MTDEEKGQVLVYRGQGMGYKKIASILGVTENAVKGFCKRQISVEEKVDIAPKFVCRSCGKAVEQNPGRKEKKFCSDKCRMMWWNSHMEQVSRKANYEFVCPNCNKHFVYLEDRYGRN